MAQGYLAPVLHCHLPFVRHPEHERFLEEDWFYEAVVETYLPLLDVLERLEGDRVPFRITLCLSPPLCEMLADSLLGRRCLRYIESRLELAERETQARGDTPFHETAQMYRDLYRRARDRFRDLTGKGVIEALARLEREGHVELVTTAATHALLPLLGTPESVYAQLEQGCRAHERHFGVRPRGMWLPECAYVEGLDEVLRECGIHYFFLETHGLLLARPKPVHGVFAPIFTGAGLAAFARDVESSKQVWSATEGYPGDPDYREFYRDLGYEGDYEYVRHYLHPDGFRHNLGIKYFRVTGNVPHDQKRPYRPAAARDKAREHAGHFVAQRIEQAQRVAELIGRPPLIVAPYDAELFGHWWFEGPQFLEGVFRKAAEAQEGIRLVTPPEYLAENPVQQVCEPAPSSWGYEGYFDMWVNGSNDWIWRHLHLAEEEMARLAEEFRGAEGLRRRALNQCARELLLAQSSDWPFLMSVGSAASYARRRVEQHISRFRAIAEQVRRNALNEEELSRIEALDNVFPDADYALWAPRP